MCAWRRAHTPVNIQATQKLLDAAVAKQAEAKAKHTNWQKTALVVSGINEAVIVFTKEKVQLLTVKP